MTYGRIALTLLGILALGPTPVLGEDALKIGFFAPLTGFAAADGASARHSAEIAVEELNAAGGIKGKKVELVVYDDRHDSKEAVAVANKLVEKDGVTGVVSGSYSMPSRVTAPIFAKARSAGFASAVRSWKSASDANGWRFEVLDLDGRRIDKVLATRLSATRRAARVAS